jgi:hypothetical protein
LNNTIRVAHVFKNLYIVQLIGKFPGIEYLYPQYLLDEKLDGKTINLNNEKINDDKEYGKVVFFHRVIKPLGNKLYFGKFRYICFVFYYISKNFIK